MIESQINSSFPRGQVEQDLNKMMSDVESLGLSNFILVCWFRRGRKQSCCVTAHELLSSFVCASGGLFIGRPWTVPSVSVPPTSSGSWPGSWRPSRTSGSVRLPTLGRAGGSWWCCKGKAFKLLELLCRIREFWCTQLFCPC